MPGDERLVPEQVLQLARVPPDPLAPHLEGERGIVRVRALLGSSRPGTDRSTPAGSR